MLLEGGAVEQWVKIKQNKKTASGCLGNDYTIELVFR